MIIQLLDKFAEEAAVRYDAMASTFENLLKSALLSIEFGSANQGDKLFNEAYAIAFSYFSKDKDEMRSAFTEIATEAHRHAIDALRSVDADSMSDEALAHLSECQTYLSNEIAAQVHRDIASMRQTLQNAVMEVGMMARSQNISTRQAQLAWMMKNTVSASDFKFTDRKGRKTPSRTFVRAIYRQTLLAVWNEGILNVIIDHGMNQAALMRYQDGTEKQVGTVTVEEYPQVRQTLFHPNSVTYLDVEVEHVSP